MPPIVNSGGLFSRTAGYQHDPLVNRLMPPWNMRFLHVFVSLTLIVGVIASPINVSPDRKPLFDRMPFDSSDNNNKLGVCWCIKLHALSTESDFTFSTSQEGAI